MATTSSTSSALDSMVLDRLNAMRKAAEPLKVPASDKVTAVVGATADRFGTASKLFSATFGFSPTLAQGVDHKLPAFDLSSWHTSVRPFIPTRDPDYVFPKHETELFVMSLVNGGPILIHGPKGSGKSSLAEQVCALLCIPYVRVNCRRDMESSALFGQPTFSGGTVGYVDGPAAILARHGGVLCVDEVSAAPAGIALSMQYMLERGGKVYLPDLHTTDPTERYITPTEWFRVVATDNTTLQGDSTGSYAGTNVQNSAFVDRFEHTIEIDYLEEAHERAILNRKCPNLSSEVTSNIIALARQVRVAHGKGTMEFTMSPRAMLAWGRASEFWGDYVLGFKVSYFNKLGDDDRKQVVEIFNRVAGIDLTKLGK